MARTDRGTNPPDTPTTLRDAAQQRSNCRLAWRRLAQPGEFASKVITIGEIQKGIEKLPPSKRKDAVYDWLNTDLLVRFDGHITHITTDVMLVWGSLAGRLRAGRPLAAIDSLVAAIALEGGYALVTRNEDDFIDTGVRVFNPWR